YTTSCVERHFSFSLLCPGVRSQIQLVPSAPGVVTPGESLTVTCTVSGDSIATRAWWNWVRELPGRGLQWVGRIHFSGSANYAPDLQTRANIAKDDAKNEYYLQLHSLTAADTATYYCTRRGESTRMRRLRLFPVTTSLPAPKAPEIFPLCADSSFPIRKNVHLLFPNYLESSLSGRKCDSGIRSWPEAHLPCLLLYWKGPQEVISPVPSTHGRTKFYLLDHP
uniref:Ig-like domain-containing protein n=1 Tax=Terrapene triunguis TaxID=2587831 RepID=A0A674JJ75_9SAUR